MNAIEAALLEKKSEGLAAADDPEARLMARIALAEKELAEGRYKPASEVIENLRAIAHA